MGRAMIIICSGLLIALAYTFMGMANRREGMTNKNVQQYYKIKAKNSAIAGVQIAIHKYNEGSVTFSDYKTTYEGADLTLTLNEVKVDIIRITSHADFKGAEHTVVSTFDISKMQTLVPEFQGALSILGGGVSFTNNNNKVHFNGMSDTCEDKPGITVWNDQLVQELQDEKENIAGGIAKNNNIDNNYISKLIDALAPRATSVDDDFSWETSTPDNPGVYFIDGRVRLSGKETGYGILVVRNDAILEIEQELAVSGQFTFNGLVIFENENYFSGTGKAQFNGTVLVASTNGNSTITIKANGNFNAQYDCNAKKYAEQAINNVLYTTIYNQLSVYE